MKSPSEEARESRRIYLSSLRNEAEKIPNPAQSPGERDVYQEYISAYPDYGGSPPQFRHVFAELRRAADAGEGVHPSLWDDFVYRKIHDYKSYVAQTFEAGINPIPYPDYYAKTFDDPGPRCRWVLANASLAAVNLQFTVESNTTSGNSSVVEGAFQSSVNQSVSTRSTSQVSGSYEQLNSNLEPKQKSSERAENTVVLAEAAVQQDGQDVTEKWVASLTSDRAFGAKSPELGGPGEEVEDDDGRSSRAAAELDSSEESDDNVYCSARGSPELGEAENFSTAGVQATTGNGAAEVRDPCKSIFGAFASSYTSLASETAFH